MQQQATTAIMMPVHVHNIKWWCSKSCQQQVCCMLHVWQLLMGNQMRHIKDHRSSGQVYWSNLNCIMYGLACTRLPTLPPLGFFAMRASLIRPAKRLPNSPPSSIPETRNAALPASATPLACTCLQDDLEGLKIKVLPRMQYWSLSSHASGLVIW